MNVVQGDNGTVLRLNIVDESGPVDLSSAIIDLVFNDGKRVFEKQATVTASDECEVVLSAEDLANTGSYTYQATVTFQEGGSFSSDKQRLIVNAKL